MTPSVKESGDVYTRDLTSVLQAHYKLESWNILKLSVAVFHLLSCIPENSAARTERFSHHRMAFSHHHATAREYGHRRKQRNNTALHELSN